MEINSQVPFIHFYAAYSFCLTKFFQPEATIGPLLEHCFNQEIFLRVHEWAVKLPLYLVPMCQVLLLQTYEVFALKLFKLNPNLKMKKNIENDKMK
jgi:hypothetical protein